MDGFLKTAKGWVAGAFVGAGFWKGFSWPVVVGTLALFLLHHWPDIVAEITKLRADVKSGNLDAIQRDVVELRDQVTNLTLAASFGKKPQL